MNKYLIGLIAGVIILTTVVVYEPNTNDISIDEESSAALYCVALHNLYVKALGDEEFFVNEIQEKWGC